MFFSLGKENVLFWALQIPWLSMTFFHNPFKFSTTLRLAVTLENFENFPYFDQPQFTRGWGGNPHDGLYR